MQLTMGTRRAPYEILAPIVVLFSAGLLVSCAGNKATEKAESRSSPSADGTRLLLVNTREGDDVGRFLAGLPGKQGSPYLPSETTAAWTAHAKRFNALWDTFEKTRLLQLQEFQKRELGGPPIDGATAFYPFGGPDALTVLELFPNRSQYVLVSLEPPGTVPRFKKPRPELLDRQLRLFGDSMHSLLTKGFFVTREMDRQLRGQVTDGLVPLLLVQLVRRGATVLRVGYVGLDENGRMIGRPEREKRAAWGGNRGVAIEFQKGDGPKCILTYLSVNLDNRHLAANPQFLKYVASLGHPATTLKATSYMVHNADFSTIRDAVLNYSAAVVQDDSGVPFRMFDPNHWQVQLYGEYAQPYGSFKFRRQPELAAEYRKAGVKPLALKIGYGSNSIGSNLLVARRKS